MSLKDAKGLELVMQWTIKVLFFYHKVIYNIIQKCENMKQYFKKSLIECDEANSYPSAGVSL